jgi:hypothetical protein
MAQRTTATPKVLWTEAIELCTKYASADMNVMFTGAPGIGKTALVEIVSQRLGWKLIKLHLCIADPTDVKGLPVWFEEKDGKKIAYFIPFGELKQLIDATEPTFAFLDDFGQAKEAVQAATMQLLHGGTLNQTQISKHVRFVACTNRKHDKAGVSGILEPVKSRFHGIFELVPELEPFLQNGINIGWSPVLIAFMRNRPEWLTGGPEGWAPVQDIVNQSNPRSIEHLADVMSLGLNAGLKSKAYAGAVGLAMANEFNAFEDLVLKLPNMDTVCNNPMQADIPGAPDTMYAMIGALHSRMTNSNLENIYTYIDRAFTKEMQMVFHRDVKGYNKSLIHNAGYIQWAAKNGEKMTN